MRAGIQAGVGEYRANLYWEEVATVARAVENYEKQPDARNLLWLDRVFAHGSDNEYRKGELAQILRQGLGEEYSQFRHRVLLPRYRLSNAQLDRYEVHFQTASWRFAGNPPLRTLLFDRWNMDRAFNSKGDFRPEVEQAIRLCGGVPEEKTPKPECEAWIDHFINTIQALLKSIPSWPRGKSYGEKVIEETLHQLGTSYPICSNYRYNRSTYFSGRLRYDFAFGDWFCPYLIEVHGAQHYYWAYDKTNDKRKEYLARVYGCPLLVIPHWEFNRENGITYDAYWSLRYIVEFFLQKHEV